jgi:hypothetical protein
MRQGALEFVGVGGAEVRSIGHGRRLRGEGEQSKNERLIHRIPTVRGSARTRDRPQRPGRRLPAPKQRYRGDPNVPAKVTTH